MAYKRKDAAFNARLCAIADARVASQHTSNPVLHNRVQLLGQPGSSRSWALKQQTPARVYWYTKVLRMLGIK